jgi:hypothetical protein
VVGYVLISKLSIVASKVKQHQEKFATAASKLAQKISLKIEGFIL